MMLPLVLCFIPASHAQTSSGDVAEAQRLAWSKRFDEAERLYRQYLRRNPASREAAVGLAQVVLWKRRYREARTLFLNLVRRNPADAEAMEGAATAAYWEGDFRTAAREFSEVVRRHPERQFAQQSLSEIAAASRDSIRATVDAVEDDQPYSLRRSELKASLFTDPLTRWDVAVGSYHLDNPTLHTQRETPYVLIGSEYVMPWQRLTIGASAGALRWPDQTVRPIGDITLQLRTPNSSSLVARVEHRESFYTATSVTTHVAVTRTVFGWSRDAPGSWIAGVEAGRLRYFDHNNGRYAQAFALMPVMRRGETVISLGASAALRDTAQSRFYQESISSTLSTPDDFNYQYRGGYTPYWTPQHLREGRAIGILQRPVGARITLKVQAEIGLAHDQAHAFGPSEGPQSLPAQVFEFDFRRTFYPRRIEGKLSVVISDRYRLEGSIGRNTTVFYRANEFRASLVRYR